MHAYMIDREDIRQSMQVIIDVSKEVQNGKNYLILPREPVLKWKSDRLLQRRKL